MSTKKKRMGRVARCTVALTSAVVVVGCGQVLGLGGLHDLIDGGGGPDATPGGSGSGSSSGISLRDKDGGSGQGSSGGQSGSTNASGSTQASGSTGMSSRSSGSSGIGSTSAGTSGSSTTGGGSSTIENVGDSGTVPPSCNATGPGTSQCGATSESCCTSLEVPGGTFDRTYDATSDATAPADPATVSGFRLDKYTVTVGRFRRYVSYLTSTAGQPPADGSGKHAYLNGGKGLVAESTQNSSPPYEYGWDANDWGGYIATGASAVATWNSNLTSEQGATWTAIAGSNETLPINEMTWYEAYAFCIWDGGFLPSDAEWEYVAAGGSEQRKVPWGSTLPGIDNDYAIYGGHYQGATIAPVGTATLGFARWGQLDMEGNVLQPTLDDYETFASCTDCAALGSAGNNPVLRGAAYENALDGLYPWLRIAGGGSERFASTGFRCSRAP